MEATNDVQEFFKALDRSATGQRVLFKRSAGLSLNEVDAATMTAFYRILPHSVGRREENNWFLAACIHCLWNADTDGRQPMETALGEYASSPDASDSLRKRFINLLDIDYCDDGYLAAKLVRVAKLLKQKGFAVDGRTLICDLQYWNSGHRSVQKKWVRAFARRPEA